MRWVAEAIRFINQNSGAMLTLATIIYAAITAWMLRETKKMREIQTEPDIFITVQPQERATFILNLVIQNIGLGAAYDLRFKVEPNIEMRSGFSLSNVNFIKNGFRYLAPKQKLECMVAQTIEEAGKKETTLHEITVSYKNKTKKSYQATFVLDFTEYFGMRYVKDDPFEGIIHKLQDIHADIENFGKTYGSKLRVVAYTKQEYDDEIKKQNEEIDRIEAAQREKK